MSLVSSYMKLRRQFQLKLLYHALVVLFVITILNNSVAMPEQMGDITIIEKNFGHVEPYASVIHNTTINSSNREVYFLVAWKNKSNELDMILNSPKGIRIEPSSNYSNINYLKNATFKYYDIKNPDPGVWTMEILPSKMETMREDYCVIISSPSTKYYNLQEPNANLSNLYSSHAIDDDRDGFYDHIDVTVYVLVKVAWIYKVSASLYDDKEVEVANASQGAFLNPVMPSVILKFYGIPHSGVYHLKNVTLYDNLGKILDRRNGAYSTPMYKNFTPNPQLAKLTRNYTDHGIDINGDGKYEFLIVNIGINAIFPGNYTLQGWLHDINGSEVSWSVDQGIFKPGYHIMNLSFDGKTIAKHKENGPYRLEDITLSSRREKGISTVNDFENVYITDEYKYSDFRV